MTKEEKKSTRLALVEERIRTFSRIEKWFYGSIVFTAIVVAISIIFLQSRNLQLQQNITQLNAQISEQETEVNNAKQEINELLRFNRIEKIAKDAGMSVQNENIQKVE